jgi:hypothetical protein
MRSYRLRVGALTAAGALLVGLPMCAQQTSSVTSNVYMPPAPEDQAAREAVAAMPLGHVASRDARGAARQILGSVDPSFAMPNVSVERAARLHMARHAEVLGVSREIVDAARLVTTNSMKSGASVVRFDQIVNGVTVYGARASVVLDASKNLVSLANTMTSLNVLPSAKFALSAEAALAGAYTAHAGTPIGANAAKDVGARGDEWRAYNLATATGAERIVDASVRKVLFPETKLVPAYHVEIIARAAGSTVNDGHLYVIAADDGHVLYETSLTANEAFNYRVWADPTGNHAPTDGPLADYTPHPTGKPDRKVPGASAPILVAVEGFNTNPAGKPDPWLAATATETSGNNVDAYTDRDGHTDDAGKSVNNGYNAGDLRADVNGTTPRTFDRVYDLTKSPNSSPDQMKAAVTQIFYVTNWLHDFWYDSGFNEAAGNAQKDNLNRGGVAGDPLKAEGQDGADFGSKNNANMSQTSDGTSPRMQMYVWDGRSDRKVTSAPATAFTDEFGTAGSNPDAFDVTGNLVLINDGSTTLPTGTGTGTTTDGCQQPPTFAANTIALVEFGGCGSKAITVNMVAAKAAGIIIIAPTAGHAPQGYAGDASATAAGVPIVGLSFEDGQLLKANLAANAVSATLHQSATPAIDGTIDNTIIAHEWGHYWHHRLVNCGGTSCSGMSEGWGDFNAIMLVVKDGDALDGTAFPMAQYATGTSLSSGYYGIRRAPYSADMTKNPFTFTYIRQSSVLPTTAPLAPTGGTNAEVHNVGEVWAETLFNAYVNLLKAGKAATPARGFDESKRRMADYIVAGMQATPVNPTFVEQRDAILAAVWATGHKDDFTALAQGFAKRGLGVGAVAPPATSTTLDEAVENFDFKANLGFVSAALDDSGNSCDNDGVLDAGETGKLTIKVRNTGWLPLSKTKITVSSTSANLKFSNNGVITVPALDPYATGTVTVDVTADRQLVQGIIPFTITVTDVDAFAPTVYGAYSVRVNTDETVASTTADNVETIKTAWTLDHGKTDEKAWSRVGDATNHVWHGADATNPADEKLVSPDLIVSATANFTVAFSHRFRFEQGKASSTATVDSYFDGGVLEISSDNGTTWQDISAYVDPGYTQTLFSDGSALPDGGVDGGPGATDDNALANRKAFAGASTGYPAYAPVSLDLGTKLAGKTVKLRFRIGTDSGGGFQGWDIDNLAFGGITNKPFGSVIDNPTACTAVPPAPDAGTPDSGTTGTDAGKPADAGKPPVDASTGSTDAGTGGNGDTGGGDSGCAVSPAVGSRNVGGALLAFLGGIAVMARRRRRSAR